MHKVVQFKLTKQVSWRPSDFLDDRNKQKNSQVSFMKE